MMVDGIGGSGRRLCCSRANRAGPIVPGRGDLGSFAPEAPRAGPSPGEVEGPTAAAAPGR